MLTVTNVKSSIFSTQSDVVQVPESENSSLIMAGSIGGVMLLLIIILLIIVFFLVCVKKKKKNVHSGRLCQINTYAHSYLAYAIYISLLCR